MAFPSIVNSASNNSGANTTSWTFTFGFTATAGNLLVLAVVNDGDATQSVSNNFALFRANTITNVLRLQCWKKESIGNESGVVVTMSANEAIAAIIWEISGSSGFGGVEGSTTIPISGASGNPDPSALNPVGDTEDFLWLAVYGWDGNVSHTVYPTNYTLGQQTSRYINTQGCGIAGAGRQLNAASEDPGAGSLSGSEDWISGTISIRPLFSYGLHYSLARPTFCRSLP